ncbi:THAP domain-containing protein 1-like [Watersipora subatra]|uniref:THAP domain-containing protein 1-like n=1 Tax=Watersipora subatra TaxID=2589382 RepID=UPI00355BA66C
MPNGSFCAAFGCSNSSSKTPDKKFHGFPLKNEKMANRWVLATKRVNLKLTPSTKLCSDHFTDADYTGPPKQSRLFPTAVPTIFNFPEHMQPKKYQPRKKRPLSSSGDETVEDSATASFIDPSPSIASEHDCFADKDESLTDND